jgi:hypothetical protein
MSLKSMKVFVSALVLSLLNFAALASAATTLITLNGSKPQAGLAKSWKKGKNQYTFTLDIAGNKGLTPEAVKTSLELKLGSSNGVKVAVKGKDTAIVNFTGAEKDFLTAVSSTAILMGAKADGDVEIAMEGGVSQGNVRARTSERGPDDGEVKGTIVSVRPDAVVIRVSTASPKAKGLGINDGDKVEVKAAGYKGEKGNAIFFIPTAKDGAQWSASKVAPN